MAEFQDPKGKLTLAGLIDALKNTPGFAEIFYGQLKNAFEGKTDAIAYIDSTFEATDQELANFNIPESDWGPLKKCTDSGLLVAVTAKEEASRTPPPPPS